MVKLSDRKIQILKNTIDDYIESAQPITSGGVQKKFMQDISSSTLRNELNSLEQMGYLKQLHTSGGRIPTSKAYRFYVNYLTSDLKFDEKSLDILQSMFETKSNSLHEIVRTIAKTVSDATNYPAVVILNGFNKLTIEGIQIIKVIGSKAIILISTSTGIINNTINVGSDITEEICKNAGNFLTYHFKGRTIADMILNITKHQKELNNKLKEFSDIFNILCNCLSELAGTGKINIAKEGMVKLLSNPEYKDYKSAQKVIDVLEDDETVMKLFKYDNRYSDISFRIGSENENLGLESSSVITANYSINGNNIASIGIIGPQRMDYSKVAAVLKYMVNELAVIKQLPEFIYEEKKK